MRNALMITYNFPPDGGPAVQRVAKFIKYIRRFNYRAVVLTTNHKPESTDKTLSKDIPEDTVIYKTIDYGIYCPGELRNKLLKNYFVPDKQKLWGNSALRKIKNIINDNKIDIIFSTSPPHSVHLIALKVKMKSNIPWVADFRDEWTKNPSFKDFHNKEKNRQLEETVIRNADHIVVCTRTAENNFRKIYNIENISNIYNGYDNEDFNPINNYELRITNEENYLNILYYGRLNKLHSPIGLLEAMRELKKDYKNLPIKFHIVGNNNRKDWMKNFADIDESVIFHSYKTHRECLQFATTVDVLLLLATNMAETEFFPAKVFEYIKLRKPILAIVGKKGELTSFLDSYGNSFIVPENNTEDLKNKLNEIIELKRNNKLFLSDNNKFIDKFDRLKQAELLTSIFDRLITNG